MLGYLLRRLLWLVPTLLGITVVVFVVMAAAPGGISAATLVEGQNLEPEAKQALTEYYNRLYGLDQPLTVQYLRWLNHISPLGWESDESGALTGWPTFKTPDLGVSFRYGRPVADLLAERVPVTVLLNLLSAPIIYLGAIAIGVAAAARRGSRFDHLSSLLLLVLWSAPPMLVGVLLIGFFASAEYWHWFPTGGLSTREALDAPFWPVTPSFGAWLLLFVLPLATTGLFVAAARRSKRAGLRHPVVAGLVGLAVGLLLVRVTVPILAPGFLFDRIWHLILPVVTLSYGGIAFLAKLTRASLLEHLAADFTRTARAKGVPESVVLWRHVFRNSLLPLITVAASLLPSLIAGSVIVETLFSIDGMGRLAVEAVQTRDRELVLSLTLISGLLTLIGYLVADIAYAVADPRVRYEG
ncbi:ABC transporter permease [Hydrogenophilus thiooxidans]|uniref:ABC transporter permease n=1 Tax=Hydrogenophilus thiooxidans TaxID=2820326 RepID=UPI001C21BCEF|nr:ABC transporter permease [Hydrogenophilus thiooxidans]